MEQTRVDSRHGWANASMWIQGVLPWRLHAAAAVQRLPATSRNHAQAVRL